MTQVMAINTAAAVPNFIAAYELADGIIQISLMGIDLIPDSYANPFGGTDEPVSEYEVGDYDDLKKRAAKNGQGQDFEIHHVPQKAVAKNVVPGYPQDPKAMKGPAIVLRAADHAFITNQQMSNPDTMNGQNPQALKLIARDFWHMKNIIGVPASALKNLAGKINGNYPSLFARLKGGK